MRSGKKPVMARICSPLRRATSAISFGCRPSSQAVMSTMVLTW